MRLITPPVSSSPTRIFTANVPHETVRWESQIPEQWDSYLDQLDKKFGVRSHISEANRFFRARKIFTPLEYLEKKKIVEITTREISTEVERPVISLPPVFGYSPNDIVAFYKDEVLSWLNRLRSEQRAYGKRSIEKTPADESAELFFKKGLEHEREFLEHLKISGKSIIEIPTFQTQKGITFEESHALTLKAMQDGPDIVYQAALQMGEVSGYADFLVKRPNPIDPATGQPIKSKINGMEYEYHYEVWDTKLSKQSKPTHLLQLCCYADMLEQLQGIRPHNIAVVTGTGLIETMVTDDYYYYYLQLKRMFFDSMAMFDPEVMPPAGKGDYGEWSDYVKQRLKDMDDLSQVAGITKNQIKLLREQNIFTMTDLASSQLDHLAGIPDATLKRHIQRARLQIASKDLEVPLVEVNTEVSEEHFGLHSVPPISKNDVYFDMEGYPLVENGLEYLFGASLRGKDNSKEFYSWWSNDAAEEQQNFEAFIDWVYVRWQQDKSMHVFHYAAYEISAMLRLSGRYGTRETEVLELIQNGVFVDFYKVIKNALIVGTPSDSIKYIEKLFRAKRTGGVTNAASSIVEFDRFLDTLDTELKGKLKANIENYNRDDCDSLIDLHDYLLRIQEREKITYKPWEMSEVRDTVNERRFDRSQVVTDKNTPELLRMLHRKYEDELLDKSEKGQVVQTFIDILNFHTREDRVRLSNLFRRLEMTEDELYKDNDSLAGITLSDEHSPYDDKQSRIFTYDFDSEQNTSLKPGDSFVLSDDEKMTGKVEEIDFERGVIKIRFGKKMLAKYTDQLQRISLIPSDNVPPGAIHDSLYLQAQKLTRSRPTVQPALHDLLYKKPPRIKISAATDEKKYKEGDVIVGDVYDYKKSGEKSEWIQTLHGLDQSTLFVQGPPGSGKSTLSAYGILSLIKAGKRVGISGPSHKAINSLLIKVHELAAEEGFDLQSAKIGGESDEELKNAGVQSVKSSTQFFKNFNSSYQLVAGTPWAFSNLEAEGKFDYLFVDEAGQVPLAHAVAMYPSSKNVVFVGDPEQLPMPNSAAHPRQGGLSVFEYFLKDGSGRGTLAPHRGVFLPITYRMHPLISDFISHNFYEGRLKPAPNTQHHALVNSTTGEPLMYSGIFYIGVKHADNKRSSVEEVDAIEAFITSLSNYLIREVGRDGKIIERKVKPEDVLIVTPYNAQVIQLKQSLGNQIRAGTVDKFQGQEAHITLISMASSQASSGRGIQFLMNPNRINVAISRAKSMVGFFANPDLIQMRAKTLKDWKLLNIVSQIMLSGDNQEHQAQEDEELFLDDETDDQDEEDRLTDPGIPPDVL